MTFKASSDYLSKKSIGILIGLPAGLSSKSSTGKVQMDILKSAQAPVTMKAPPITPMPMQTGRSHAG
jgi:hypothetical protein